jgi:hypothetical protein
MLAAAARMTGPDTESIAIAEARDGFARPGRAHSLGYLELHCGNVVDAEKMLRMALYCAQRTGRRGCSHTVCSTSVFSPSRGATSNPARFW